MIDPAFAGMTERGYCDAEEGRVPTPISLKALDICKKEPRYSN
jgi:hypothetical protein